VLGDDDLSLRDETAGGAAGWLHEALPSLPRFESTDDLRGFGRADSFVAAAFGEEREDGGFEGCIGFAGLVAAAGVATVLDDVPVLRPLLAPLKGAATGLADLVLVRGCAFGFVTR